jgi:mono/diheme cytochrome c family protein
VRHVARTLVCRVGTHAEAWFVLILAAGLLAAQTTRSVWDGVYTSEQSQRGAALYASNCASCHGSALGGGESAPPLTGGEFSSNWNGLTVGDLFERIRTTMPADRPGKLTREQDADVLAYMLSVSQFPPGKAELEHQAEVLRQIRFDAYKP